MKNDSKPVSIHERWKMQDCIIFKTKEERDAYEAKQRKLHYESLPKEKRKYIYITKGGVYKLRKNAPEKTAYTYRTYFETKE